MDINFEIKRKQKNSASEPHAHDYFEILMPIDSKRVLGVHHQKKNYEFSRGKAFLIAPHEEHYCLTSDFDHVDRFVIQFSEDTLSDLTTRHTDLKSIYKSSPLQINIPSVTLNEIAAMLAALTESREKGFGDDIDRNLTFQSVILHFANVIHSDLKICPPKTNMNEKVQNILKYIHDNYNKNISLDTVCSEFYISKPYANQIFHNATGLSINRYIIEYRIMCAYSMLEKGFPPNEVCRNVGFNSYPHFSRTFKKITNHNPVDIYTS
jgi:AraC family L-rhamnose operon regulatory protein RhaS